MNGRSAQRKGKEFEREVCRLLAERFNLEYKNSIRRTPCSGGIHSFMSQDVICMDKSSVLSDLHIECKKTESLNFHKVYWRTRELAKSGKIALVIHSKNFDAEPTVTLGFNDFCNLLKCAEEAIKPKTI